MVTFFVSKRKSKVFCGKSDNINRKNERKIKSENKRK